jgi:hypothetical protein
MTRAVLANVVPTTIARKARVKQTYISVYTTVPTYEKTKAVDPSSLSGATLPALLTWMGC